MQTRCPCSSLELAAEPKLTLVMVPRRQQSLADALGGTGNPHMKGLLVLEWGRGKFSFVLSFPMRYSPLKGLSWVGERM